MKIPESYFVNIKLTEKCRKIFMDRQKTQNSEPNAEYQENFSQLLESVLIFYWKDKGHRILNTILKEKKTNFIVFTK